MLPSVSEIIGFLEIADSLNITKAAGKLGVTQPTLSQSLKKLEESVGETLVIRSKNGVELTRAGKTFQKYARQLLDYWNLVKFETKSSVDEVKGMIKLGCHPSVGLYTLDLFLPELVKQFNDLEFTLHHDLSRRITEQVIAHEIDLGLVINPIKHPDLIMIKLLEDEVKIWQIKAKVPDILICHPDLIQTQDILKKMRKKNRQFKRIITSENLEIITKLTLNGAGFGLIPGKVIDPFNSKGKLVPMENSPIFKDELFLIFRVENKNLGTVKKIKDSIVEIFK